MLSFGRFTLLVRDYDEALAFYRDVLGFDVLHDSIGEGGQRFLHIGNAAQGGLSGLGLWLLKPGSDVDRSLIGRQSGRQPFIVLYTPDCSAAVNALETRGVKIRHAPKSDGGAVYAHFEDLYGNEIVMVELAAT
jgi:predicted enzyme related to lactoylglutathione lyase